MSQADLLNDLINVVHQQQFPLVDNGEGDFMHDEEVDLSLQNE